MTGGHVRALARAALRDRRAFSTEAHPGIPQVLFDLLEPSPLALTVVSPL